MTLQSQYVDVRSVYQKVNPTRLPENESAATRFRPEKVKVFTDLLGEYDKENSEASRTRQQRENEIAQFKAYIAFHQMRHAYRQLNPFEVFGIMDANGRVNRGLLPAGIKLDGDPEVLQIGGISLTSGDPTYDFEQFLSDAYMEIDYMSSWSIEQTGESKKVRQTYLDELKGKGLLVQLQ